jgi:hypothetical protein
MKEIKFTSKAYSPKPFGADELNFTIKSINSETDPRRTICNVLRMAFNCMDDESPNLNAARSLILEAFWMGGKMNDKLSKNKKEELKKEVYSGGEGEYYLSIDWKNYPARGSWD